MAEIGLATVLRRVAAVLAVFALLLPGAVLPRLQAAGANSPTLLSGDASHPHFPAELAALPHDHGGTDHGRVTGNGNVLSHRLAGIDLPPPPSAYVVRPVPSGEIWSPPGSDAPRESRWQVAPLARAPPTSPPIHL